MAKEKRATDMNNVAAAVNWHVKALRLLGRTETSVGQIANALSLTDGKVLDALREYRIVGVELESAAGTSGEKHE